MEAQTLEVQTTTRYVVYNEEMGVFLGDFLGLTFWSKMDPCGQPEAWAFESTELAQTFIEEFKAKHPDSGEFSIHPIECQSFYATVPAIEAAGLPGWEF